jgi:sulfoquinovosyltransferase
MLLLLFAITLCTTIGIVVSFRSLERLIVRRRHHGSQYISTSINNIKNRYQHGALKQQTIDSSDPDLVTPPLSQNPPYKVLLLVEPTPFTYISGYSNRFKEMLNYMHRAKDQVEIFTPDSGSRGPPPKEYLDYPITTVRGFELIFYKHVTLSYDLRFKIPKIIKQLKPDIIHCAAPSALIYPAALWSKVFNIPLLASYHTDFVKYGRTYVPYAPDSAERLAKFLVKTLLSFADLVLCTSPQLKDSIIELGLPNVDVWRKGINTEIFSPSFRSASMRDFLTQGHPEAPGQLPHQVAVLQGPGPHRAP